MEVPRRQARIAARTRERRRSVAGCYGQGGTRTWHGDDRQRWLARLRLASCTGRTSVGLRGRRTSATAVLAKISECALQPYVKAGRVQSRALEEIWPA